MTRESANKNGSPSASETGSGMDAVKECVEAGCARGRRLIVQVGVGLLALLLLVAGGLTAAGYLVWTQSADTHARLDRIGDWIANQPTGPTQTDRNIRRLELEREAILAAVQDLETRLSLTVQSQKTQRESDVILRRSLKEFGDYVDDRLTVGDDALKKLTTEFTQLRVTNAPSADLTARDGGPHGETYVFENGDIFVGTYVNDQKEGFGTYTFHTGEKYAGTYKHGLRHGHGAFLYANGDSYEGEFHNGKRHGHGTYAYSKGGKYVGEFKENRRDGEGCYINPSGERIEGLWSANAFVGRMDY